MPMGFSVTYKLFAPVTVRGRMSPSNLSEPTMNRGNSIDMHVMHTKLTNMCDMSLTRLPGCVHFDVLKHVDFMSLKNVRVEADPSMFAIIASVTNW
jgi:hypothetical protein